MDRRLLATLIPALLLTACGNPTVPCGTFTFTGTPSGAYLNTNIDFLFGPAACSATCTCSTVCYIQAVRVIDIDTGEYLAPNSEQADRIVRGRAQATLNGWSVDRLAGRVWGYYGRNNDGTFASTLTTGSNTTTATERDGPGGFPAGSWMDFISVPTCIDSKASCANRLLGYQYWLFTISSTGAGSPFQEIGVDWNRDSVAESIVEWNNKAPGLGKNLLPAANPL